MKCLVNPGFLNTVDGVRIFYNTNFLPIERKKNKKVLVFNYGLCCSDAHWSKQIPFFHAQGYSILVHDYRGHFSSTSAKEMGGMDKITFEFMVQDLLELLNHLKIDKVFMLGHSMGVNTTLEFAKLHPQMIEGMILISGSVFSPHDVMFNSNVMELATPLIEKFASTYPDFFKKIWRSAGMNPLMQKAILRGGFNKEQVSVEFIQTYLLRMGRLPNDLFFHLFNLMKEHDILNYLETIAVRTLVMGGDKDQVIPYYLQKILASKLPDSQIYLIKDGSHVPNVDFPHIVNQRIEQFIQD